MRKRLSAILCVICYLQLSTAQSRLEIDLSGKGWKLWCDNDSTWKYDDLFLPPVDISKLSVKPPSGGWNMLTSGNAINVNVPGTVEEYLQKTAGPNGDITGVSWWYRNIQIPKADSPRRLILHFDAVRQRAEIFINQKLVGYDVIGNTPFDVDLSEVTQPGETVQLAVRITDPGGNFDWKDGAIIKWGKKKIPSSHGFGGITGNVKLISCNPTYIDDIFIRNTPAINEINAEVTIQNCLNKETLTDLTVSVTERNNPAKEAFHQELKSFKLVPGKNLVTLKVSAPEAKQWEPDNPALYNCHLLLKDHGKIIDDDSKTFGFRWFEPSGIGKDAMFVLNGKRIVLRTAISWGFWPVNGIYPTPELAEKQVQTAKDMGLNMLNFHRCIGQTVVLDKADELGLLYYEEPGNYRSGDSDPFAQQMVREKLLRMVRRDRSHPSLVIYNMINELRSTEDRLFSIHARDIRDAHRIDPTRTITHTSAWAEEKDKDDDAKVHMRPNDTTLYLNGWYDFHHAGGPAVWNQDLYKDPHEYYNFTDNTHEIVYWGEEGAISTPPRLQLIKASLDAAPYKGWDGNMYLDWFKTFDSFMKQKNLYSAFPSVDALTTAMGKISMEHQGRKIETIRLNNVTDGYAINGWEAEIIENHSGVVDCFRNPKADPAIINYYNQPLYVAVKPRKQVLKVKDTVIVDFYAINEKNLRGPHTLRIVMKNPAGKILFTKDADVILEGGFVYGQLLSENIEIPVIESGLLRVEAKLLNPEGIEKANGRDEILVVDWESSKLEGKGAIWEHGNQLKKFFETTKKNNISTYSDQLEHPDWVVVSRPPTGNSQNMVPAQHFMDLNGKPGVTVSFYKDEDFNTKIHERTDKDINFSVVNGSTPDPAVSGTDQYNVRWEGKLIPTVNGTYYLELKTGGTAKLYINGEQLINIPRASGGREKARIEITQGKPVNFVIDMVHTKGDGRCQLFWSTPEVNPPDPQYLIDRVKNEGTTLILVDNADTWMDIICKNTNITYKGKFYIGTAWLGGVHFVKQHPLFKDLPANDGMNWPYQAVVQNGAERYGLELEGEELVAGAYHAFPMKLGTAVGIIPCGRGRIIFSTLSICNNLNAKESSAEVARKLLCNFIEYATLKE